MTDEEIRQLKHLLNSAVAAAYAEPGLPLENDGRLKGATEQSFVFRVGIHLHELLKPTKYAGLNLDSEYRKHGDDQKLRPNGSKMRPDILIHSRGNDENNIMAVEFAGWWKIRKKPREVEGDRIKLKELTDTKYTYGYRLGALVKMNKANDTAYEYFRDGEAENS